ncbi:MAG: pseudouridine synthase [Candidatus Latescibacterota bacterium]
MNKPTGVVSTSSDPMGRPTVVDICKKYANNKRLFPVGRLDINTTGVILLTDDGLLCYRLTHPRFHIPRTYQTHVRGIVTDAKMSKLNRLSESQPRGGPAGIERRNVELIRQFNRESILRITLYEGKNRQVRRMCEAVGLRVVKLKRIRFGPVTIRKLPVGAVRPLTKKEIDNLEKKRQ